MNESVALAVTPSYRDLIKEVFINPIRTTVVVDDEYPTLDELLVIADQPPNEEPAAKALQDRKRENYSRVRQILHFCRTQAPPWLVDVHDGKTPPLKCEQGTASHLDHSDLLILDYHLESNGSGQKAIEILQHLAGNGHFNLVVVYTKDREEAGGGIDRTVNEISLGLAYPVSSLILNDKRAENLEGRLSAWEDIQEDIYSSLLGSLDSMAFLKTLEQEDVSWKAVQTIPELAQLAHYLASIPESVKISADDIFALLLHRQQNAFLEQMSKISGGRVTTGKNANGINWIRTDSLFVTVVSKEHEASSIPERLLMALEAWDPTPHRLIMSKMRSELDQKGATAEAGILRNQALQAGWLKEILEPDDAKRRTNVRLNVGRHWESLGGEINSAVVNFAEMVATYLLHQDIQPGVLDRFDRHSTHGQQEDIYLQLNRYACSKPVEGHHLSTGHVLKVELGKNSYQYWLCLTPACDLVQGQGDDKGWKKRLGTWMPFKAVRLFHVDKATALKNASRGYHLFLQPEEKLEAFGFSEKTEGTSGGVPTLLWEQWFAAGSGKFEPSNKLTVACIGVNGTLSHKEYQAVIVAQLRYEYSLNLLHKFGSHLSRVGLDFNSYIAPEV
ncbi:MAG: response regulator receiver domain [Pseudomonadota bacterium]